jgi:hypothetical protein
MKTNETPHARHQKDFDATAGDHGPWANAWHPSWGENGDQPEATISAEEDAQEFSSDDEESRVTDSPSS